MTSKTTLLFGGAISTVLPETAIDVSSIRPVPDTQEVFMLPKGNLRDQSFIVDLLETVDEPSLPEIMVVHLSDMLDEAPTYSAPLETFHNENVGADVHTFIIKPAPSRSESEDVKIILFVALIQVSKANSDIILTLNVPVESSGITQEQFFDVASKVVSGNVPVLGEAHALLKAAAQEFNILEYSLFA